MRELIPTPINGWRVFWGEVGIIVLGVLIALGAQQFAETVDRRADARQAEQAIRGELETNLARLRSRAAIKPCVDRRIEEIQKLINSARDGDGSIQTPKWVGRPQFWMMQVARWQATSEAGRAALVPAQELARFGNMYALFHRVNDEMTREQGYWAELRSLEHFDRLTPDGAFTLTLALQHARYSNFRLQVWTRQLFDLSDQLKLRRVANDIMAGRSACIPIATPRAQAIMESNSITNEEP